MSKHYPQPAPQMVFADAATQSAWLQLDCTMPAVAAVFAPLWAQAVEKMNDAESQRECIALARFLGKMGRGAEPLLVFLEQWPLAHPHFGLEGMLQLRQFIEAVWRSPNHLAITPLLESTVQLAEVLVPAEAFAEFLHMSLNLCSRSTPSIHGRQAQAASVALLAWFSVAPRLCADYSLASLAQWMDYGLAIGAGHPERETAYFSASTDESIQTLRRGRVGTHYTQVERALHHYLQALWQDDDLLIPYTALTSDEQALVPYFDEMGYRIPDVIENHAGVLALNIYRLLLAHMAAHRQWSTWQFADNLSPMQRMAIEWVEDMRVDALLLQRFPGLKNTLLALHPQPIENACEGLAVSTFRHRLSMLSRAVLDDEHGYRNATLLEYRQRFLDAMKDAHNTAAFTQLALSFVVKSRQANDHLPQVYFTDTSIPWRDDNRHLWRFIEEADEEVDFSKPTRTAQDLHSLPPKLYAEWDWNLQQYRPDWVSLFEAMQASGQASRIDALLDKHQGIAKQLRYLVDRLKPQNPRRERYQEQGSELDLDVALRALLELKSGNPPAQRIHYSMTHQGRSVAVLLLLDLSESLNQVVSASTQTLLELSVEAVSLLAYAVDALHDPIAIAGFQSNTRHEVRYCHIKGFSEPWGDAVKARLATLSAAYSTRMGAALRHAEHYLSAQSTDKKLLLVLSDGEPADIDSPNPEYLTADAAKAVQELASKQISTFCINLDAKGDAYAKRIFGKNYCVIDRLERLPERLPQLFMALTH